MTYTLKDIKHLETMAKLANTEPVAKKEINIRELIAETEPRELSFEQKIVSLCAGLRRDGFDKQASKLEYKFLSYKSASASLYGVFKETGEDLVDDAHKDGDVQMGSGEYGIVETITSGHKKILDKVNKQPTGKLAGKTIDEMLAKKGAEEVIMSEIAKKFKYMADYLQSHFLAQMPEGQVIENHDRNFYGIVGAMYELADKVASELNSAQTLPLPQALQMVMNRLMNAGEMAQGSVGFKSMQDLDNFINTKLSWAEDNKPVKLASYVDRLDKIFKKSQMIETSVGVAGLWQSLKEVFGDFSEKADVLKSSLEALTRDNDARKSEDLMELVYEVIPELNSAIQAHDMLERGRINKSFDPKELASFVQEMTALKAKLPTLHKKIDEVFSALTTGVKGTLYHYTFSLVFKEAARRISGFEGKLAEVFAWLRKYMPTTTTPATGDSDAAQVQASLNKMLDELKASKLTPAQQEKTREWIETQQKELAAANGDAGKITQIARDVADTQKHIKEVEAKNAGK